MSTLFCLLVKCKIKERMVILIIEAVIVYWYCDRNTTRTNTVRGLSASSRGAFVPLLLSFVSAFYQHLCIYTDSGRKLRNFFDRTSSNVPRL